MVSNYSLALEVDRVLKLNLSNGRFEKLANLILSKENSKKYADELMTQSSNKVLAIINDLP